jgi:hypothetical protein
LQSSEYIALSDHKVNDFTFARYIAAMDIKVEPASPTALVTPSILLADDLNRMGSANWYLRKVAKRPWTSFGQFMLLYDTAEYVD